MHLSFSKSAYREQRCSLSFVTAHKDFFFYAGELLVQCKASGVEK